MRSTLNSLLSGQLDIEQFPAETSAEQKRLLHQIIEKQQALSNQLDEDENQQLNDLLETMNQESSSHAHGRFVSGFILGMMVATECFTELDNAFSAQ